MKARQFILLSILLISSSIYSQSKDHILSGYVREKGSKESLIGVNVYIPKLNKGTTTNRYGFYSIPLPEGKHSITYSFIGYKNISVEVDMSVNRVVDISLEPSIELEGVEIHPGRASGKDK